MKKTLITILLLCAAFCYNQISAQKVIVEKDTTKMTQKMYDLAIQDLENKEAKYYQFGLMPPNEVSNEAFYEKYGIKIVNQGCVVNMELMEYNKVIAKHFQDMHKKNIENAIGEMRSTK